MPPIPHSVATNVFVRAVAIYIFGLLFFFLMCGMTRAQTSLSLGDVQTLGVTTDTSDSFSFVLWKDISANTILRFMDHSFTNATTGVNGTENDMSLTFNTALTAGTVVRVVDGGTTTVNGGAFSGTKTGSLSGVSVDGDQVFIYQGTAIGGGTSFSGRTLLHGFNVANTSWLTTGTASAQASYIPTVITGADASFDSGNFDNVDYTGARTGLTAASFRAAISSITNYTQNDTRFDLATGGFTIASATSLHWDANGSTAGNGGTGTWDTTTADRFKNGASGTTFLRWVNSSTGNDHTAVFGGTAGTVGVATGGVTASGLQFDVTGYTIQSNTITLAGTTPAIDVTTGTATISSALAGSAGLTKSGSGTLIVSGANTYTGAATIGTGTLALGASDRLNDASTLSITGGIFDTTASNFNETVASVSMSSGSINGAGTLTSASYNFSGGTVNANLGEGTLTVSAGTTALLGSAAVATVNITGGTLALGAGNSLPSSAVVTLGSGAGSGKLVLGTASAAVNITITGLATSGSGTANAVVGGNAAVSTLTILDNTNYTYNGVFGGAETHENNLNIIRAGSSGTVTALTGNSTSTGTVTAQTGTISVATVDTGSIAQPLGAGNLIQLGSAGVSSGTLRYTGGTGTLDKNITAFGNGSDTVQNSGSGLLTLSGTLTKNGTTLVLQGGSSGIRITGTVTGAAANSDLVVDGGAVTLDSPNSYNGPTFIRNGATLTANVANALPTSPARSDIVLDDTGSGASTLALGASQSVASLSGASSSTVNLGGNTLTIGKTSGSTVFGGTITGSGSVQKDGGSTLTLNSANTHSGGVTVTAGTVAVKNTTGSATGSGNVTVTGSTILGTGRVSPASGGSVIFGNAAILSVGDAGDTSGKKLIFTPASGTMSTTFQSGSVVEFDLFTGAGSGDNSGIGTSADALQWGGTLALQSNVKLRVNNPNGMTAFAEGDIWKVLDWTTFGGSAPSGIFEASMLELPTLTGLLGWDTSNLYTAGTIGIIQVPEPSRAVLILGGLMAIAIRRKR